MKHNLTKILSILTISLIFYACKDNNEHFSESIMQHEITESEFFSVAYNYSDTIRLTFDGQGYADIVVSSDKKDVLESHLSKYEYYLVKDESIQEMEDQIDKQQNNMFFNITKCDISEIPKIGIEIIETGGNFTEFDIRCRPKKHHRYL